MPAARLRAVKRRATRATAVAVSSCSTWATTAAATASRAETGYRYRWFSKVPLRDGEDARLVEPFRLYLDRHRHEGCRNRRQLWREIVTDSFKGSFATLARWAAPLRGVGPAHGAIVPAS